MKKIKLVHNESSLHRLNFKIGETQLYMKRDDILDFAFGGNKVRLFEYIAAVILDSQVDKVITYGSSYSNYVRVAAAVCAKLNVACDIIILDEHEKFGGGNEILLDKYNVNIVHCPLEDAHDFIDAYQEQHKNEKYLWIPGGGHMPEAAFGYVDAAKEMIQQAEENDVVFDAVFLPCGTGTTQAGMIYGLKDYDISVIGISVARPAERCVKEIYDMLKKMALYEHGEGERCGYTDWKVQVLGNMGISYGTVDERILLLSEQIAQTDGIFLDPIYNAKAFLGMKDYLEDHPQLKSVLYINTGGLPNIFIRAKAK